MEAAAQTETKTKYLVRAVDSRKRYGGIWVLRKVYVTCKFHLLDLTEKEVDKLQKNPFVEITKFNKNRHKKVELAENTEYASSIPLTKVTMLDVLMEGEEEDDEDDDDQEKGDETIENLLRKQEKVLVRKRKREKPIEAPDDTEDTDEGTGNENKTSTTPPSGSDPASSSLSEDEIDDLLNQ